MVGSLFAKECSCTDYFAFYFSQQCQLATSALNLQKISNLTLSPLSFAG